MEKRKIDECIERSIPDIVTIVMEVKDAKVRKKAETILKKLIALKYDVLANDIEEL